ncbi:MAG: site-specific integrase, partial [Thermodesulfobacteriota bacterium]|nr:site-specific integrase [Thermodesulfobacteriota bacterium]
MISLSLKKQIEFFIESLSSEKGYSANTCRAYSHDLKEFVSFIYKEHFSGKKNQNS